MEDRKQSRVLAIEALDTAPESSLLAAPLDYIFAEHFRQRTLCRILDEIADEDEADPKKITSALRFLQTELDPHVVDEEADLFPLLRRRAEPEDEIEKVIQRLCREHTDNKREADQIIAGLSHVLSTTASRISDPEFQRLLKRFAASERRHLILENAVVLPLARIRLTKGDLDNMGKRMAARRGFQAADQR